MCQDGTCYKCQKEARRDASRSAKWQPPKVKQPRSSNQDDEPPTDFLNFTVINTFIETDREARKKKKEGE